jgi:integrase
MASVYKRGDKHYIHYKDAHGKWRDKVSTARTKTEAKRLAGEIERKCERQRHGLEPLPDEDGGGTFDELMSWWLVTYSKGSPSHQRSKYSVEKNLIGSELGRLRLTEVTAGSIEVYLQARAARLSPQTLNHLRRFILTAFNLAKQAGRFSGVNPASEVARRKVEKRLPDFLRAAEVPRVLSALSDRWRPLFATAIYTGMRRGELLGLRKSDVDLSSGLINVSRSHGRETTKGGRAEAIPMARELVPYVQQALARSPAESELVFPKEDGRMMRQDVALEGVLRRALGRAGIVKGYQHVCRKKGCGHVERAADAVQRRCPQHKHLLWPKADVRPIRFHDLRHTTASLLMMAGANPAAVQRILRHRDPRITTEVYGHLAPGYLQSEVDRLQFGMSIPEAVPADEIAERCLAANAEADPFAAPVLQSSDERSATLNVESGELLEIPIDLVARPSGFEPLTYGSGGRRSIQLS